MSGWQSWVCAASAAALLLGVGRTGRADPVTLFAITFNNELLSVNTATGAGELIGSWDNRMAAFGLGDRGSELWTFDQRGVKIEGKSHDFMVRLDPSTGATLETVDIGVATSGEGAVAYRSDGTGFLVKSYTSNKQSKGKLWSFDVEGAGNAKLISGAVFPGMDGMDFDGSDMLYGLSQKTNSLYTIDPVSGLTTLRGSTGLSSNVTTQGLTFAPDGRLFAAIDDSLYHIDPLTGAAGFIGAIGFSNVSGLSFLPATAVPVPLAAWTGLVLLGILGMRRARSTCSKSA